MDRIGIAVGVLAFAFSSSFLLAADVENQQPVIRKVVGVQLRERGALLIESFDGDTVDESKWRIWHSDPKAVAFSASGTISRGAFGVDFDVPLGVDKVTLGDKVKIELEIQLVEPA